MHQNFSFLKRLLSKSISVLAFGSFLGFPSGMIFITAKLSGMPRNFFTSAEACSFKFFQTVPAPAADACIIIFSVATDMSCIGQGVFEVSAKGIIKTGAFPTNSWRGWASSQSFFMDSCSRTTIKLTERLFIAEGANCPAAIMLWRIE